MEKKTEKLSPQIPYYLVEGDLRSNSVLTAYTHGGLGRSRIFHTAENGLNFEFPKCLSISFTTIFIFSYFLAEPTKRMIKIAILALFGISGFTH